MFYMLYIATRIWRMKASQKTYTHFRDQPDRLTVQKKQFYAGVRQWLASRSGAGN